MLVRDWRPRMGLSDPPPPRQPLPGDPPRRPPPPQPLPGPPTLPPGTPRRPPRPDDLLRGLEARIEALEAQGSRFWAIILELCGRLPEPDPIRIAGDLVPLKVAAARCSFSVSGLRARVRKGVLPCTKIGGRAFISEADLPKRK